MKNNLRPIKTILLVPFFLSNCSNKSEDSAQVKFPSHIYLEKTSPDKKTKAIIFSWTNEKENNMLGSEDRFILGFTKANSKWYIDFELSEGFGTYEGGVTDLKWLNDKEVLIKRRISDRSKDIKYNLISNEWTRLK